MPGIKGVPQKHVARRHRLPGGGMRIFCRMGDYTPPGDTLVTVQEAAFRQHRVDMGEQVAPERKRIDTYATSEELRRFTARAAREGMTVRAYMRKLILDAIATEP